MAFIRNFLKLSAFGTLGGCSVFYYWLFHTNDYYRTKYNAIKLINEFTGEKRK